jgi:hypothetical protein
VLQLLPGGSLDGLESVELRTGRRRQDRDLEASADSCTCRPDPLIGRLGQQVLPGIFAGHTLGVYLPQRARIQLFAYVYDPSLPDREMWELVLRGHMLRTLVHEVAHHYDHARRTGKGRWFADEVKAEPYARLRAREWERTYILPYLREGYPEAYQTLAAWLDATTKEEFEAWRRASQVTPATLPARTAATGEDRRLSP